MQGTALVVVCLSTSFTIAVTESSINYCGSRMCGNTNAHTFCQYPEGPSPQCVGYISANLTDEEKARVIARLNRRRNEAAAGRLRGLASAGNMLKLRWVEELAREAQRWADQCRPPVVPEERDLCRDLYSVPVGQCIASVIGEAPGLRVESMIDIWYMQNILYKGNATNYIPPNPDSSFYGDFGQMMWAQSYMVGCGRSRFMTEWRGRLRSVERLVCNVAPRGPPPGRSLWSPSAPATLCPPRSSRDASLEALCDIQIESNEIQEVDASMTLEEHFLLHTVLDIERNASLRYPGSLDELYLTRLAIATMDNIASTEEYYNSVQKRDVIEDTSTSSNVSGSLAVIPLDMNTSPSTAPIPITSAKKKISLIGRPKPYNMEELTDMDLMTENYTPNEDTTKSEKDFYAEYEFVETMEENSTVVNREENVTFANSVESTSRIHDPDSYTDQIITEAARVSLIEAHVKSSVIYEGLTDRNSLTTENLSLYNNPEIKVNDSQIPGLVTNESLGPDNALNYLSDQETVLELQEALEVIERDMSTERIVEAPGKVRRELREEQQRAPLAGDKTPEELPKNKNLDKASMYNMVLQYMPYLRDYQSGLLSKAAGRATRPYLSSVLVVSFCLYF
ncbi:unnamed protein product [Arctia plantaginis]|uniref:SCP domain-containing protein n=1 Tax=Arctia plantaginis TaxID=874455 RepID=A0A8S0YNY2_ARCPL|nr:unnamed protein product [Arctia plantaginis]